MLPISTKGFGFKILSSDILVPLPPDKITSFITTNIFLILKVNYDKN
jgi:hypothetical protein